MSRSSLTETRCACQWQEWKDTKARVYCRGTQPSCTLATNYFAGDVVLKTCRSSSSLKQQGETLLERWATLGNIGAISGNIGQHRQKLMAGDLDTDLVQTLHTTTIGKGHHARGTRRG